VAGSRSRNSAPWPRRFAAVAVTLVVAAIAAVLLLGAAGAWPHAGHPPTLQAP
jgi:hypothetical protein